MRRLLLITLNGERHLVVARPSCPSSSNECKLFHHCGWTERLHTMEAAPQRIEVEAARLAEFERELHRLLKEATEGKHDTELRARGITIPPGMTPDAITTKNVTGQAAAADLYIELAISYAPLVVPIATDLWAWVWPKLRDYFDGSARDKTAG